jgi:hypothetical protein
MEAVIAIVQNYLVAGLLLSLLVFAGLSFGKKKTKPKRGKVPIPQKTDGYIRADVREYRRDWLRNVYQLEREYRNLYYLYLDRNRNMF